MSDLRKIQTLFRDALFENGTDGDALQAFSKQVQGDDVLSSVQHVRIYRRAVLGTLLRAMGNIYPVCRRLVGDDFFDAMSRIFVRAAPSGSPDLGDYGKEFPAFVQDFEHAKELPYLADVAELEWCWHRAFHAPDEPPSDMEVLSRIPATEIEQLCFRLPVSAHLRQSRFPTRRIWEVNQKNWHGDSVVDLNEGPEQLMIWRSGFEMRIDKLDEQAWTVLNALHEGRTLGAVSALPGADDLDTLLPRLFQSGWITGLKRV